MNEPRARFNVDVIKDRLDLASLAERYGASFHRHGNYRMAKCPLPGHIDRTPSFVVYDDTQHFHCFGCQAHGDAFTFLAAMMGLEVKRDFRRLIEEAASLAGVGKEVDASLASVAAARVAEKRKIQAERDRAERAAKAEKANQRWLNARVITPDDCHARYFREARGVDLFRDLKRPPAAVRVYDAFRWNRGDADNPQWAEVPVICTALTRTGKITATHLTFLDGARLDKSVGQKGRIILGSPNGASMHIARGTSGLPPRSAFEKYGMADTLALTEGLEDALSVAALQTDWRVWAAYSLDNIGNAEIPDCAGDIVIAAQNDKPGAAPKALERVKEKLLRRAGGRSVRVAFPPAGVKDWNEIHQNE